MRLVKHPLPQVRLVNLTQHPVTFIGEITLEVHPSGQVARIDSVSNPSWVGSIGVNITRPTKKDIIGLPEYTSGTIFITSPEVAGIARRADVMSPIYRDGFARGLQAYC